MSSEIWVAIITSGLSLIGVLATVIWGNKKNEKSVKAQTDLTIYRINQLEQKVNKHNNLIERMYKLEDRVNLDEEKIRVANHRIDDLEEYHK
ncbi:MAG: hypothetical protein ACI4M8_03765 [Christensenellales bacterium]